MEMKGEINMQMNLIDSCLVNRSKGNDFLEKLVKEISFGRIQRELDKLYSSTIGRPSHPPMVMFRMMLLQFFYNLSDPQVEEQVNDRLSFRKFVGLDLEGKVPDETSLVRFRQRLIEHGVEKKLLGIVNQQLAAKGLLVKKATIVDATLIQAAPANPTSQEEPKDPDAGYTSRKGKAFYGYKAHVASDADGGFVRKASLTSASVHDSQMFEKVLPPEQEYVFADKAYASEEREQTLASQNIASGIAYKAYRNRPLTSRQKKTNSCFASIRCRIEKIFGHWKRNVGYRRVRYIGLLKNELELQFRCVTYNLRRMYGLLV
jgi:IS5 family transposase